MTEENATPAKRGPKPKNKDANTQVESTEDVEALKRRIAELESKVKRSDESTLKPLDEVGEDEFLINVVSDRGITYAGRHWHKSQELLIRKGTPQYEATVGTDGKSWLDLANDPVAQEERFGEVLFRAGPYKGKAYVNIAAKDATPEALEAAMREERLRNREVPMPHTPRII